MNASFTADRAKLAAVFAVVVAAALHWAATTSTPPVDQVQSQFGIADETTCQQCHGEIVAAYQQTGHRHTLTRGDARASTEKLRGLSINDPAAGGHVQISLHGEYPVARFEVGDAEKKVALDWCFGSGRHARTWAATLPGSWGETDMLEFRWTWYRSIDGFDVTPGQQQVPEPGHFAGLGTLKDAARAVRCFACHASYIPVVDGRIDLRNLEAGINCQRCHGPLQHHAQGASLVNDANSWSKLTPLESINRCGQCHRRGDETPSEQIRPDNVTLTRFQPVGLAQSPCFQQSKTMTCMTCHDPHRPLSAQDSRGTWQCLQCHDHVKHPEATLCSAGHRDDCLTCHMPKVKQEPAPLEFTDHWIRVREN